MLNLKTRQYIYLDLKDWITLSKDYYNKKQEEYSSELNWVFEKIVDGRICFPLVDTLFLEFFKNNSYSRRYRLAKIMSSLSLGYIIADKRTRLAHETRIALSKSFKNNNMVKTQSIIIRGFPRAFASDEILAKLVGFNKNRLTRIIESCDNVDSWIDYFITVDEETRQYLMDKFRKSNQKHTEMLESFRKSSENKDLLLRTYFARLFMDNQTTILQIANDDYGISKSDLLEIDIASFISNIPSFEIEAKLTIESMKQKSRKLATNDCYDISSLATAIPYCSIIITEAFWVDLCLRLGFDKKYKCIFLKNYRQLPNCIKC